MTAIPKEDYKEMVKRFRAWLKTAKQSEIDKFLKKLKNETQDEG